MLERITRQVKTIETLFGEVHEGVVVVDEKVMNENGTNDNNNDSGKDKDMAETPVLFYNETASKLLKTRLRATDLENQQKVETRRIRQMRVGGVLHELQ